MNAWSQISLILKSRESKCNQHRLINLEKKRGTHSMVNASSRPLMTFCWMFAPTQSNVAGNCVSFVNPKLSGLYSSSPLGSSDGSAATTFATSCASGPAREVVLRPAWGTVLGRGPAI